MESTGYTYNICAYKNVYMCAITIDKKDAMNWERYMGRVWRERKGVEML